MRDVNDRHATDRREGLAGRLLRALRGEEGFALVTVVLIVSLMIGITAVSLFASRTELRIGANDYATVKAGYAAEAGGDKILAVIDEKLADGVLTDEEIDEADDSPPEISGYTFTEYTAEKSGGLTTRPITQGPFAGMQAKSQDILLQASVAGPGGTESSVELSARTLAIPIFQFAVFYEQDLENCPGPRMDIRGRVHSNGHLYLASRGDQYFHDMITTAGQLHLHTKASSGCSPDDDGYFIKLNDGTWQEFTESEDVHAFCSDDDPEPNCTEQDDKDYEDYSKANWDHRIQTRSMGIDSLRMPVPADEDPYFLTQPCTGTEGESVRQLKYACNASLTIELRGDVLAILDGDGNFVSSIGGDSYAWEPDEPDEYEYAVGDAVGINWDAFYDDREQDGVGGTTWEYSNRDVIEIDLWELLPEDYPNGIIYVTADSVRPDGTLVSGDQRQYSLRLRGGAILDTAVTVATNLPAYILGDYNSDDNYWRPSSIVSDALTLLSNSWQDSEHQGPDDCGEPSGCLTDATETKYQVAIISGHTATPFYGSSDGGGWFNNFPRFLEDWDSAAIILGSFVSMWEARVADSDYDCCSPIYSPPVRDWGFDSRFSDPANLPPATPVVGQVLKIGYIRKYY